MAASTISRSSWTDDDGTGTTGTIIGNSRLQADVYDKIDALLAGSSPSVLTVGGRFRTEGAGFQVAGNAAPAVSAAGEGNFYFDSTRKLWLQSYDGEAYLPLSTILAKSNAEQDVSNTATETSVFSKSIKALRLGANGILRLTLTAQIDLSAVSQSGTLRLKFGATTFASGVLVTTASTKGLVHVEAILNGNGATNQQRAAVIIHHVTDNTNPTDAAIDTNYTVKAASHSTLAEDTTADKTLDVTWQWASAAAAAHFKRWAAVLEMIG